jgi:hypothetical protein
MIAYNISSPIRTQNSDYDFQVWSHTIYSLAKKIFGEYKTGSVRLSFFNDTIEIFLVSTVNPDSYAIVALENNRKMKNWDADTITAYATEKAKIAHLTGKERKQAKAILAEKFGLNPSVYLQVIGA